MLATSATGLPNTARRGSGASGEGSAATADEKDTAKEKRRVLHRGMATFTSFPSLPSMNLTSPNILKKDPMSRIKSMRHGGYFVEIEGSKKIKIDDANNTTSSGGSTPTSSGGNIESSSVSTGEDEGEQAGGNEIVLRWRAPADHPPTDWIGIWTVRHKKRDREMVFGGIFGKMELVDVGSGGSGGGGDDESGGGSGSSSGGDADELLDGRCVCWAFIGPGRKGIVRFSFKDGLPKWPGR